MTTVTPMVAAFIAAAFNMPVEQLDKYLFDCLERQRDIETVQQCDPTAFETAWIRRRDLEYRELESIFYGQTR